ncbi:MAG: 7-cyano-7-deazaguanine synthase QueC [Armatimonadetes bacterium]|nr:7-cyano-7-deazaguanine synthase QueC [Armatimonadota bacterium]
MAAKKAIVLLSGGMDSATCLAIALHEGYVIYTLSFRYGQRHEVELECARRLADRCGARHRVVDIDLRAFGGSALTDDIEVPKERVPDSESLNNQIVEGFSNDDIPITYVPARNTIFLSFALAWAEVLAADDIFIGVNALDYSGYPDCRPEYIDAFQKMADLATKAGVEGRRRIKIHTPLIKMTKAEIVTRGLELRVDYSMTISCYDPTPGGVACGRCDACRLRLKGFSEAGAQDPVPYQQGTGRDAGST